VERPTRIPELKRQSFIVRLWLEDSDRRCPAIWRGSVTHVSSGECKYISDLGEITPFVAKYLNQEEAGAETNLQRWLRHLGRKITQLFFF